MKKIDFYFSPSFYEYKMDPFNWFGEHDDIMPVVKLNGKYVPFCEQITHGNKPILTHKDLKLIATLNEDEVDIEIVKKLDFYRKGDINGNN